MPKKIDLTGQEFNLIRCISPAESKNGKTYWNCECIKCGVKKIIQTSHIKDGSIKTCGCGCSLDNNEQKQMQEKECEICRKKFIPINSNAKTRKYCYECSPSYTTTQERTASIIQLRKAMKHQAVLIKGGKCEICGYDKCEAALQFHHRNPKEKSFGLGQGGNTHSWSEYLQEVMKCDLLCANCHLEKHYLEDK